MYGQMPSLQTTPDKVLVPIDLAKSNGRGTGGHKSKESENTGLYYWEKTDILASSLIDAVQVQYTVTGRTRRKPNDESPGVACEANDKKLALFLAKDNIYCIDGKCPHQGGPLAKGDIQDMEDIGGKVSVVCPWHRWTFELETGKGVGGNACGHQLKTYPTRVDQVLASCLFVL
jgi:nitrite reductase/ring-hydroxylating ferredoxin subunit